MKRMNLKNLKETDIFDCHCKQTTVFSVIRIIIQRFEEILRDIPRNAPERLKSDSRNVGAKNALSKKQGLFKIDVGRKVGAAK